MLDSGDFWYKEHFLILHHLQYEDYPDAEDHKLWFEIARRKGIFYVEAQPLLNRRTDEPQIEQGKEKIQSADLSNISRTFVPLLQWIIHGNRPIGNIKKTSG